MELRIFFFWIFFYFVRIVYVVHTTYQKKYKRRNKINHIPAFSWSTDVTTAAEGWPAGSVALCTPPLPCLSDLSLCCLRAWAGSCFKHKQSRWLFSERLAITSSSYSICLSFRMNFCYISFILWDLLMGLWCLLLLWACWQGFYETVKYMTLALWFQGVSSPTVHSARSLSREETIRSLFCSSYFIYGHSDTWDRV